MWPRVSPERTLYRTVPVPLDGAGAGAVATVRVVSRLDGGRTVKYFPAVIRLPRILFHLRRSSTLTPKRCEIAISESPFRIRYCPGPAGA